MWDENMSTGLLRASSRLPAQRRGEAGLTVKLREVEAGQVLGTPHTAPAFQGVQVSPNPGPGPG